MQYFELVDLKSIKSYGNGTDIDAIYIYIKKNKTVPVHCT